MQGSYCLHRHRSDCLVSSPRQGCLCSWSTECTWPIRISVQLAERPWTCQWFLTTCWTLYDVPWGHLCQMLQFWVSQNLLLGNEISSLEHFVAYFTRRVSIQITVCPAATEGWGFIILKCYTGDSGLFCLNMLPDYILNCIGLNHLIHSKFLNQKKNTKNKKKLTWVTGDTVKSGAPSKAPLLFDFLLFRTPRIPPLASGFPGFSVVTLGSHQVQILCWPLLPSQGLFILPHVSALC